MEISVSLGNVRKVARDVVLVRNMLKPPDEGTKECAGEGPNISGGEEGKTGGEGAFRGCLKAMVRTLDPTRTSSTHLLSWARQPVLQTCIEFLQMLTTETKNDVALRNTVQTALNKVCCCR